MSALGAAAVAASQGVGLGVGALMLMALAFALGIRTGQRSLRCRAHGRACTRCGECP